MAIRGSYEAALRKGVTTALVLCLHPQKVLEALLKPKIISLKYSHKILEIARMYLVPFLMNGTKNHTHGIVFKVLGPADFIDAAGQMQTIF